MTAPLSMRARQAIESFAAKMGVTARVAADHSYGFEFSRLGTLSILQSEDDDRVIVSLARVSNRVDALMQRHLLNLAGYESRSNTTLHAGIASGKTCVLALAFDDVNFSEQSLDEALFRLNELQNFIAPLSQTRMAKK
jgi:hypothetical protein